MTVIGIILICIGVLSILGTGILYPQYLKVNKVGSWVFSFILNTTILICGILVLVL